MRLKEETPFLSPDTTTGGSSRAIKSHRNGSERWRRGGDKTKIKFFYSVSGAPVMGLSEVSLCWCQGEIWRRVVLRLDAPGLFLPVSLSTGVDQRSSAQSPLLVIAGGFFLCSQRQTRGSSVSLGARWYLFLLVVSLGVPGGVCGYPAFWRVLEFKVLVLHGCVASVYHQTGSLGCEKVLSLVFKEGASGSSSMALSHRLSCVPGGSVYLSSLSQQLQINRFFSNEARIRLGGSAWSHVQLSVREGCKLGGPRKLCS
ncbi:hypothetical protein F2Q69_00037101 [Brassica cretica]|uniref:Uncharacterized protein n=1 Tax=Brassica cretica TaxID=69181 RepID=A0A8S9SQ37_BRACR|nr:hypothetical protein F2Q69_00037101 [Brassica cretica]